MGKGRLTEAQLALQHRATEELEGRGLRVENYLPQAQQKDGGATPATLAWLLSSLEVPAQLPGSVDRETVRRYIAELEKRMLALAAPR